MSQSDHEVAPAAVYVQDTMSAIIVISLLLTLLSAGIGNYISPGSKFDLSVQLLVSNTAFDILTFFSTVYFIRAATMDRLHLTLAVVASVFSSSLFAMLSLWFAHIGTPSALPYGTLEKIFCGRTYDQSGWEFGPYFWIMHSTFAPLLAFMLLMLAAILQKKAFEIVAVTIRRDPWTRPHGVNAALLGILSAIVAALYFLCKHFSTT